MEKKNNYANSQLDQREVEILRKTQGEGNESAMSLKIQNEQLKRDNQQLVELLGKSKEFKHISDHINDSGGSISKLDISLDGNVSFSLPQ